ncbi:unnamed protein product [Heligmosomoides polygyrus]|uniref:Rho-GAP domain-containing protein n=1 Tax=Heligmosomoides polygyrus TaxID=6339 RepID=A0A3P8BC96_HELPZ|nr:unnamed protein product [Heligmosomoides polygyrus]
MNEGALVSLSIVQRASGIRRHGVDVVQGAYGIRDIFMSNPLFIELVQHFLDFCRVDGDENNIVGKAKVADPFTVTK